MAQSYMPISQWFCAQRNNQLKVAFRGNAWITLGEMKTDIVRLRKRLLRQVSDSGHCVASSECDAMRWVLCFDDSYLFTVAFWAVLSVGAIPVISGYNQQELLREQTDVFDGLITDLPFSLDCPVIRIEMRCLIGDESDGVCNGSAAPLASDAIAQDACVILYTSGSTGAPKQVRKPIQCLDAEMALLVDYWAKRLKDCRVLATVTHQHQYGLTFRILLPMALGLPFDSGLTHYQEQLLAKGKQNNAMPVFLVTSPAWLKRLDQHLPLMACDFVLSAGGVLDEQVAGKACAWLQVPVHEIYGSTETGVIAWRERGVAATRWQCFKGVQITWQAQLQRWVARSALIDDPQGIVLEDRLGFSDNGLLFELYGRYDRIIKLEEKKVSLFEIEARLNALDGVVEGVALSLQQGKRQVIGAVLVLNEQERASFFQNGEDAKTRLVKRWTQAVQRHLDPVAVPRQWRVVERIPLNTQSKRDYDCIRKLFG